MLTLPDRYEYAHTQAHAFALTDVELDALLRADGGSDVRADVPADPAAHRAADAAAGACPADLRPRAVPDFRRL